MIQECGVPLYGDFEDADEDMIDSNQNTPPLPNLSAAAVTIEDITSQYADNPQAFRTTGQEHHSHTTNASSTSSRRPLMGHVEARSPNELINAHKWFELCINNGFELTRLGEIPLVGIKNDSE